MQNLASSGGTTAIITRELAEYLTAAERISYKKIDLPLSRTALKRLRAELGIDWFKARETWWRKKEDLRTLTLDQFAMKYGVSPAAVSLRLDSLNIKKPRHTGRPLPDELDKEIKEKIGSTSDAKLAEELRVGVSSIRRRKGK